MKKILMLLPLLFLGCASLAVPRFQNMRSYEPTNCDPVLSVHIPQSVALNYDMMKALTKHPDLADKIIPMSSMIESITRNGAAVGLGSAAIISAIQGNLSVSAVVSSAVLAGVKTIVEARSEDKTQDRVDVCFSKDADFVYFKNEDQVFYQGRNNIKLEDVAKKVKEAEKNAGNI